VPFCHIVRTLSDNVKCENQIGNGLGITLGQGDEFFSGGTQHGFSYGNQVLKLS